MSHLDPGLLHELLDGEIPSSELAPIQAHLASCEECRARLENARQLQLDADGLVAAIEVPMPAEPRVSRPLRQPSRPRWRPGLA
jgi:anti-sigma factor RsiW